MAKAEELLKELAALRRKLVIVEGPKDRTALVQLSLRNVVVLRGPIHLFVERIAHSGIKEVVILSDLDREGRAIYGRLKAELARAGIAVDDSFRNWLFRHTPLRQIEGLPSYLEKLRRR